MNSNVSEFWGTFGSAKFYTWQGSTPAGKLLLFGGRIQVSELYTLICPEVRLGGCQKKQIGACFLGTKQPALRLFLQLLDTFFPKKSVATQSVPSVASCFVGHITSIEKDLQAQKAAFRQLRSKCLVMQMFLGKFRLELIPRRLLSRMFRQPRS